MDKSIDHRPSRAGFRTVRTLVTAYVVISWLTVAAIVVMRDDPALVNPTVWVRGVIVAVVSLLTSSFAVGAARGHPRAFLRLRIVAALMVVAVVVFLVVPGSLPLWMKLEQGVCGLLLLGVAVLVNGPLRTASTD